ncbi:uncharacterized protein LOC141736129 isoform X3 [Larus michahellis]|uniref:uncharacterized protein LOC141736129 isoform X3 n=1 Tax=Larus michahellis TaxID=119627 RepID=UPI003D9AD65B
MASCKLLWSDSPQGGGTTLLGTAYDYAFSYITGHLARWGISLEDLYIPVASIVTIFESLEYPSNVLIIVLLLLIFVGLFFFIGWICSRGKRPVETLPAPLTDTVPVETPWAPAADIAPVQTPPVPVTTTVPVQTTPNPATDTMPVQRPPVPATTTVSVQTLPSPAIGIAPVYTLPALPTDPDLVQTLLALMTRPAAATSAKSTLTLVMDDAADLQTQSEPVSVDPVHDRKSAVPADSDGQPGTLGDAVTEEVTRSLSLRDIRKDYSRQESEQVITWLLRCWNTGADSLDLDGREVKRLGPLARKSGIDRGLVRPPQSLTLWKRLLLRVRGRYPYRSNIMYRPSKWTTIERGIKNLREIAVWEMTFSDLGNLQTSLDSDALKITRPVWHKWLLSAPAAYVNALALFCWRHDEAPTVGEMGARMQRYAHSLLSAPQASVSVLKKSFGKASISAGDKRFPTKPVQEKQSTSRYTLWSTLRNQGENMRNWDGKPTSALQTWVRQLRSKTTKRGDSSRRSAAPVSSDQSLRRHSSRVQATVCFHLERGPVYLELIAPAVETQPYYLPWTDPDCTGEKGGAPEHLEYIDDINIQGNTAEVFEKGEKVIQILLEASFAIKQVFFRITQW